MTLEEAEEQYKASDGDEGYLMWHEFGSKKTEEYHNVIIPNDLKAKWDREIIEQNFRFLEAPGNSSSNGLASILSAMGRGFCNPEMYAERLLDLIEKMRGLDALEKVNVIRNMGATTSQFRTGGIDVYRRMGASYLRRMDAVMQRFMDFTCPDEPASHHPKSPSKLKLYRDAVDEYRRNIK